ncbi:MAG: hypothetical protein CMJ88_13220 [Planctomycetes bacterium]|nr:hypothetical protein [Planctomycetota bacterium]
MIRARRIWIAALLAGGFATSWVSAQEARVPVKVLGGRLVARCQLSSPTNSAPVNLWLAFDKPVGLELHNKVASGLAVEQADGTALPITIELPGLDIEVPTREHGDEQAMEDFTRVWAPQMEEVACAGTIGAKVLADYEVTFDLPRGQVRIKRAVDRGGERPSGPEALYVPASVAGDVVWMPATLANGTTRMIGLGSTRYDSVVDEDYCYEIDQPGGSIGRVALTDLKRADFDLSKVVAWRPELFDLVHRDGALATLGIGFLQQFRVQVDAKNGWIGLTRVRQAPFPAADAAFFAARAEEDADALVAWIKEHGASRLGRECADLLLQMQVDEGAPKEAVVPALQWAHAARPRDLRATEALAAMDTLVQARRPDLAVIAGRMGVSDGRGDRYPEAVHRLHVRLGELLLGLDDTRGAWEHLMSAAFGLTDAFGSADRAKVNLLLGQVYERKGKNKRAMSRYVQAVISPEFGPQAVPRIEMLQQKMGGEPFSVALVDRMISGKVRSMSAPTRFEVSEKSVTNRTVLIEHVTNPHLGQKQGESWRAFTEGGAMAFEALQSHFPAEHVVMLGYHTDAPRPVAIMNELSLIVAESVEKRPVFLVDGSEAGPGACRYPDADTVYQDVRAAAAARLKRSSSFGIELEARVEDGVVRGEARIRGPARGRRIELVLAEKGAIYPGLGATVVHRMVARAALTSSVFGAAWRPKDGGMVLPFARPLEQVVADNLAFLEDYEARGGSPASRLSTAIAADQLVVVAIVRDPGSRRVDQCASCEVEVVDSSEEQR